MRQILEIEPSGTGHNSPREFGRWCREILPDGRIHRIRRIQGLWTRLPFLGRSIKDAAAGLGSVARYIARRPFFTLAVVSALVLVANSGKDTFWVVNSTLLDGASWGGVHVVMDYSAPLPALSLPSAAGESARCSATALKPTSVHSSVIPGRTKSIKQPVVARVRVKRHVETPQTICLATADPDERAFRVQGVTGITGAVARLMEVRFRYQIQTDLPKRLNGEFR